MKNSFVVAAFVVFAVPAFAQPSAPKSSGQMAAEMQLSNMAQQDEEHLSALIELNTELGNIRQTLAGALAIKPEKDKPLPTIEQEISQVQEKLAALTSDKNTLTKERDELKEQLGKMTPKPEAATEKKP